MGDVRIQGFPDHEVGGWYLICQAVEETVAQVLGVQSGRDAENVVVGGVMVCSSEEVWIANDVLLGYCQGKALEGSAVREGAVVNWRIEYLADVV